jgi:aminocarboxymuconate-semialdehyde decarboxylase
MVKRCGVQQIVCGIDDPYPLGEMDSVPDCYPGKLIDDAVSEKIINSEEAALIWHDNALKWIYG